VLPVFHLVIGHAFVHILAAEFEPAIDQPCQLLARAVIALGTPSRARRRRRWAPKALWLRSRRWSARRKALAARLTTLRVPRFIILSPVVRQNHIRMKQLTFSSCRPLPWTSCWRRLVRYSDWRHRPLGKAVVNDPLRQQAKALLKAISYSGMMDLDYRLDRRDGEHKGIQISRPQSPRRRAISTFRKWCGR
jgi:hypothetical protein